MRPHGSVVEPAAAPAEQVAPQPQAEQAAAPSERTGYIKGFYISYAALGNADFIAHAQDLLENTELNAIVMDFKSDRGLLTFPTQVPLAQEIGAGQAPVIQDPAAFLGWFKERGVHTVARIVIFKDTVLASAYPSLAIIDAATGNLWRDQEQQAWVDPNRQEVWDYNTALAVEAARLGFDEVQFDYVRFPTDGNLHTALYALPNTYENRTAAISGLLRSTQAALAPYGVVFGVDVFGYTPWVNDDVGIGQEIETLAPYVDYLAPMVYPSTFANGLPGQNPKYANAIAYPYEIVHLSTIRAVARARAANPAVEIRPWLQDFGDYAFDWRDYTPGEIRAQMDGAREAGEPLLPGAHFDLYRAGEVVGSGVTGGDGRVTFADLPPASYVVVETEPPAGYTRVLGQIALALTAGQTASFDWPHRLMTATPTATPSITPTATPSVHRVWLPLLTH